MKAEEILNIDFSKYKKVMLDKVVIAGAKITAEKDKWDGVVISGFINDKYVFSSFYDKGDEVRIKELDDQYLIIARREERKG
ncbi:hypothetical protein [Tissierella praeacuta]|uniref:hypothetical protein n=1 Tax=Tissierella praeacuta TaxID=43131 RepID=UPI00333F6535